MHQLESLKKFSTIAVDTGDIECIHKYSPEDATTNPSLILKTIYLKKYQKLLQNAILYAKKQGGNKETQIINATDKLSINIGIEILKKIPGYISTEIDSRLSLNYELSIKKAIKIINMYQEENINKNRILIKLAATWEGIKAAETLEKNGIKCNLTLLFSFAQARACAEAGVYLISPFVGRIYDWYQQKKLLQQPYNANIDPGVQAVKKIYLYYKTYHYKTIIMAASFRNVEQIIALAGCDRLTISPYLLEILNNNSQDIQQKLFPPAQITNKQPKPLSKKEFQTNHIMDSMATEKLQEGIHQFSIDQKKIENFIANILL